MFPFESVAASRVPEFAVTGRIVRTCANDASNTSIVPVPPFETRIRLCRAPSVPRLIPIGVENANGILPMKCPSDLARTWTTLSSVSAT